MSPADKISLFFPSIKIFRVFLTKGGRSSAFISKNVGRSGNGKKPLLNKKIVQFHSQTKSLNDSNCTRPTRNLDIPKLNIFRERGAGTVFSRMSQAPPLCGAPGIRKA